MACDRHRLDYAAQAAVEVRRQRLPPAALIQVREQLTGVGIAAPGPGLAERLEKNREASVAVGDVVEDFGDDGAPPIQLARFAGSPAGLFVEAILASEGCLKAAADFVRFELATEASPDSGVDRCHGRLEMDQRADGVVDDGLDHL